MRMPVSLGSVLSAVLFTAIATGEARGQTSRPVASQANLPLVQFIGRRSETTKWPTANVAVDRDAYVTVVAITPGVNRFAVQVLSPSTPQDDGFVRPRHPQRLGYFSPDAVGHRVARGRSAQPPIVVGISSHRKPDLSAFARGSHWASDLVINVPIDSTTDLVDVVARVIFRGDSVHFGVAPMPSNLPGVAGRSLRSLQPGESPREAPPSRYLGSDCYNANKSARELCMSFDDRPGAFRWLILNDQHDGRLTPVPAPVPAQTKPPAQQ